MCVIAVVEREAQRPTIEMVQEMWKQNPAGGGVAWRDPVAGQVAWHKMLTLDEIIQYNSVLPVPYVLHFRIPSVGGYDQALTHPFPVDPDVSLDAEGHADHVLFHNGTWNDWKDLLLKVLLNRPTCHLPDGQWSDSRAMAYLASVLGVGFLNLINEKITVFSMEDVLIYGGGWKQLEGHDHLLVSNDWWIKDSYESPDQKAKKANWWPPYHTTAPHSMLPQEKKDDKDHLALIGTTAKEKENPPASSNDALETGPFTQALILYKLGKISKNKFKMIQRMIAKHKQDDKSMALIMAQLKQWEQDQPTLQ